MSSTWGFVFPPVRPCTWNKFTGTAPPKLVGATDWETLFRLKLKRNSSLMLGPKEEVAPSVKVREVCGLEISSEGIEGFLWLSPEVVSPNRKKSLSWR